MRTHSAQYGGEEMFFQIAALAILAAFYGCYFGKMAAQRKKGIKTDRLGEGKSGFVKWVELGTKATTILAPAAEIVCICLNVSRLPVWARYVGLGLALTGVLTFISAMLTMRDSWRAGVPENDRTELVTDGIYRISRNPAFLGFDLVYIGILMMFFHWGLLALSALTVLALHLQIVNVEEDYLIATFGQAYLDYRKQVCRYIGRKRRKKR